MPKLISHRKSRFATLSRTMMADTRIKSNHKILYAVLCSLAESCDSVFPSYSWLAEQVGYEYTKQENRNHSTNLTDEQRQERAMKKFIMTNLEPLIALKLVKVTENDGGTNKYEIFDYEEPQESGMGGEQKSSQGVNKKVHTTVNKKVHTPYTGEYREENTEIEKENILSNLEENKNARTQNFSPLRSYPNSESMPTHVVPMSYDSRLAFEQEIRAVQQSRTRYVIDPITDPVLAKWGEEPPNNGFSGGIPPDTGALERLKDTNPQLYEKITQTVQTIQNLI